MSKLLESTYEKWKYYWEENGFECMAIFSVIVILLLFFYNWFSNKSGTYTPRAAGWVKQRSNATSFGPPPHDPYFNYREHTVRDSKLELLTKYHLEDLFQQPFWKIRPQFLKNELTGKNMEIDLFNKDLRLAVEVQGVQHYKFTPRYHLTEAHFYEQVDRDRRKANNCRNSGINLIEVPYHIKEKDVRQFLVKRLKEHGYQV